MAEGEDSIQYFRCWVRREYITQHAKQRRAKAKAEGARRLDVTLSGAALDDYATVRQYIEGLNCFASERKIFGFPIRLSDFEIVKIALVRAAASIREDDDQAAKSSRPRFLGE